MTLEMWASILKLCSEFALTHIAHNVKSVHEQENVKAPKNSKASFFFKFSSFVF